MLFYKTISKFFILAAFATIWLLGFGAQHADAAGNWRKNNIPDGSYDEVFMPELSSTSIIIDDDNDLPIEPNIGETKFIKYPAYSSIDERVDRLLYGSKTYIKPELDKYGHEIRRYMARVGNMDIFHDHDFLLEQYRNVRKAEVIAEYWGKHIEKEITEIEDIIDNDDNLPLNVRTNFRQNKVVARSFIMNTKAWVDAHKMFLEKVGENQDVYDVQYPEIIVVVPQLRNEFFKLLLSRHTKLKDVQKYPPFAMMVY